MGSATDCAASLVNNGEVGTCKYQACWEFRGPTYCSHGSCFCKEGFCRYPAGTVEIQARRCLQRVPGLNCHISRLECRSAGLTTTICSSGIGGAFGGKGVCVCAAGYHLNAKNECVAFSEDLAALGNSTDTSAEDLELLRSQGHEIALNVLAYTLCMAGFLTALTAAAIFSYRMRAAKQRKVEEEQNGYTQFLPCE